MKQFLVSHFLSEKDQPLFWVTSVKLRLMRRIEHCKEIIFYVIYSLCQQRILLYWCDVRCKSAGGHIPLCIYPLVKLGVELKNCPIFIIITPSCMLKVKTRCPEILIFDFQKYQHTIFSDMEK